MLRDMAKNVTTRGRPADPSKMTIWCRIDTAAIKTLDAIAAVMEPKPSRAQLIDLAVREYAERNKGKSRKGDDSRADRHR
jgi:hypothetical protein